MNERGAQEELLKKVAAYRESILQADDPGIAETVWATTAEASFIHPRGHERGWMEIRENFYGKTMAGEFSTRELNLTTEPTVHIYGSAAVVAFDWSFTATARDGGETRHTTGRESQVYANLPGLGWRLVHVHYSGPATTA